jgi:hypothetical protein
MGKAVSLDHAGVYEVIEAYRLPYYLAAAFEAVVCAGRFGVPVRTDLARALAYLNRLQRCTSPAMQPRPAPHAVQRRLPPLDVAMRLVGAGKWDTAWQHRHERWIAASSLLCAVCQRQVLGAEMTTGPAALKAAAAVLTEIVGRQTAGRDVFGRAG